MGRQKPRSYLVRLDPEFWLDVELIEACSTSARLAYLDSLAYLATIGDPTGMYPHAELSRQVGDEALVLADQLMSVGAWSFMGLGYRVHGRSGCCVVPERRAVIPDWLRATVYERDGYTCLNCGATEDLSLDHIYPWSLGGLDTEENLRTLCRPCNSSKGARV